MDRKRIIMNFSAPPSSEDLAALAEAILESMPDELAEYVEDIELQVEELPPLELEEELDLESAFDLLVLYRPTNEKIPGVMIKNDTSDPVLILFRRCILDLWCETEDDLSGLVRHSIISEIGREKGYDDEEIEEMAARHHQGML